MGYQDFLRTKQQLSSDGGFEPLWMPGFLFDFQRHLVEWAIRKGRAAIFADCGLGKTPIQLVWAENVVRKTNGRVLILTPLAVGQQMVREGDKFGIELSRSDSGELPDSRIVVTNYERLGKFDPGDFEGVVCDESSILKNFDGVTKGIVTEFMRTVDYRLLATATAAPNDFVELGTSAEALGEMGYQDMLTRFFRQVTQKDHLGWGRTKYLLKGHAERDFWRWVTSWSRACRRPSDLGFEDGDFVLKPLVTNEHVVLSRRKRPGLLFDLPATTMQEEREERRRTIVERCERAASLINGEAAVCWCHLNDEGDMLTRMIGGAEQVSGRDSIERKEELLEAFANGELRVLVTKPRVAGYGLNWQHCSHQTFFPSHSFEQWYQAIRRCWRFGQRNTVVVDMVSSEGEEGILGNLRDKEQKASQLFDNIVKLSSESLQIGVSDKYIKSAEVPSWL